MHKKDDVKKKIEIFTKLYEGHGIIYACNLDHIPSLKESKHLTSPLNQDLISVLYIENYINEHKYSPLYLIMKLVQKIIVVVSNIGKSQKEIKLNKDKLISDIESMLQSKADEFDFIKELNKIIYTKNYSIAELAKRANADYKYLNELVNRKKPKDAIIGRDFVLKLCLALELKLDETNYLISLLGYIICGRNPRDIIISVCIESQAGLQETNLILYEKGFKLL